MKHWIVALIALVGVTQSQAYAQAPGYTLSFEQALVVAQGNTAGLTLVFGRVEAAKKVYGFYMVDENGNIIEKEVHGTSGKVVFEKTIPKIEDKGTNDDGKVNKKVVDLLKTRTLTKLSNARFIEIALEKNGGVAGSFKLRLVDGVLQVQVGGGNENGSQSWTMDLDFTTGQPR